MESSSTELNKVFPPPMLSMHQTLKEMGFDPSLTPEEFALIIFCPNLFVPHKALCIEHGFSIRAGWIPMLTKLCHRLEALIVALPEEERGQYFAIQVKEKFGGLRFYMSRMTKEMSTERFAAEQASCNICEKCGDQGERCWSNGWVNTLCSSGWCRARTHTPDDVIPTEHEAAISGDEDELDEEKKRKREVFMAKVMDYRLSKQQLDEQNQTA